MSFCVSRFTPSQNGSIFRQLQKKSVCLAKLPPSYPTYTWLEVLVWYFISKFRDAAAPVDYSTENGWCHHRVTESCQECPLHSKGPELPQQMECALTFLLCCCSVITSVQFIVQLNSQVLVRCHHLNVCSLDVHLCARLSVPAEIHHQLFGLPGVELEVVLLASVYKVQSLSKSTSNYLLIFDYYYSLVSVLVHQSFSHYCILFYSYDKYE